MSKKSIKTMLKNKTENTVFNNEIIGIVTNDTIKYIDNEVTVTIKKKENKVVLERRSKDYYVLLPLLLNENTKGVYDIKNLGSIDLIVYTSKLEVSNNLINVEYKLIIDKEVMNDFYFCIEMEDVL